MPQILIIDQNMVTLIGCKAIAESKGFKTDYAVSAEAACVLVEGRVTDVKNRVATECYKVIFISADLLVAKELDITTVINNVHAEQGLEPP